MTNDEGLMERLRNLNEGDLFGIVRDFFLFPLLDHMDHRHKAFHGVRAFTDGLIIEAGYLNASTRPVITVNLGHMTVTAVDGYKDYANAVARWFTDKCKMVMKEIP